MEHSKQIRALALRAHDGLTAYLAVHDLMFREAATFKSFLKNLLGRGVPMSKLLSESEALLPMWDQISADMQAFRNETYDRLLDDEQHYFDLLSEYVRALHATVRALIERQRLMNEGSKGVRNNPMTWMALQNTEEAYKAAVVAYMAAGEELNAAGPLIFDAEAEISELATPPH